MDDPLYMVGRNVLFVHWPIEPERLRPHVPDTLTIDTFDASAWLGIVAFRVTDLGFGSATRSLPVPLRQPFPQLNCRTYVRHGGEPGVYFFSLDTGTRIGATVGRRLLDLPCFGAKMDMTRPRPGRKVGFRSRRIGSNGPRASFEARYRPDCASFRADPGSIEESLIERYRFYLPDGGPHTWLPWRGSSATATVRTGEITHDPWELTLADATIRTNTLFEAVGIDRPTVDPVVRYSPGFATTARLPRTIES